MKQMERSDWPGEPLSHCCSWRQYGDLNLPDSSLLRSRSYESQCECERGERFFTLASVVHRGNRSPRCRDFHWLLLQESPHQYQEQSSSIILWTWSGHNCECSLASPDAHQSLHTNAELKTVTKLWNIQRLARMHRSLHMHNRRTRDKTQHGTNCMNCLILRHTVWFWDRTICGWDRLYITTQATKVLPWAHKTARLGTQLSNIHASPDAFTNYLTHLSSPIFPESESMCAETSLACAHRRIHFKVTEV